MRSSRVRALATLSLLVLAACDDSSGRAPPRAPAIDLAGAGATFPYPLLTRWISRYAASTGVRVNYRSIGSDAGIRELAAGSVDFSATEAPLSDPELASLPGGTVLQLPVAAGAVAVAYNLPAATSPLRLTGALVAGIYLGRITRWDDRRLRDANPGLALPARAIGVVTRTDGSGTSFVVSSYLSQVSPAWAAGPGLGKALPWPVGTGAQGNEGVAGGVKQAPYSIGFVELAYARQNRLAVASLQNRRGAFVVPSSDAVAAAVHGLDPARIPEPSHASLVDRDAPGAYPICSFTWIVIRRAPVDSARGSKLAAFIRWALREGGPDAEALGYAPLPATLAARVAQLLTVTAPRPTR